MPLVKPTETKRKVVMRSQYSDTQKKIVYAALKAGVAVPEVAKALGIPTASIAAFQANLSRR